MGNIPHDYDVWENNYGRKRYVIVQEESKKGSCHCTGGRAEKLRHHQELADLLYLFKPDLTVIDGIIGGEGNTPAPVDPVQVHKIVASNNSVEADRITTKMMALALEQACHGGCLAAVKTGLEFFKYKDSMKQDFKCCFIMGPGVPIDGERYWFDRTGKPYSKEDLKALPMKKYGMGDCTLATTRDICFWKATGCCDPAKNMSLTTLAGGYLVPIVAPNNPWLLPTGFGALGVVGARMAHILKGEYVDAPRLARDDHIFDLPKLTEAEKQENYLPADLPKMNVVEKAKQLSMQPYMLLTALPITVLKQKGSGFHG